MSSTQEKKAPSRWPAASWTARCKARPDAYASWEGDWSFRVSLDAQAVEAAMAHLGWSDPQAGEGEAAAHAFAALATHVMEMSTMMCGFEARDTRDGLFCFSDNGFSMRLAQQELQGLEGLRARRPGERAEGSFQAWWSGKAQGGKPAQLAQFWSDARAAACDVAATMIEALERLGAKASVDWSSGFGPGGPAGASRLPPCSKGWERGMALRAQAERGEAWRALGPKASKALGRSALAKTFGPWHWFKLMGRSKSVWRAAGGVLEAWSFTSGLGVYGPAGPARQAWRCREAQDPRPLALALEAIAPGAGAAHVEMGPVQELGGEEGKEKFEGWARAQMEAMEIGACAKGEKKARARRGL